MHHRQAFAVPGPCEAIDITRLEVGYSPRRSAANRLVPEVFGQG